ncbi:MAG: V-type ATPase 116kDa subunit family protein [Candidatus Korarchaeota archaeon]|nr:hypothetical protein [Thermoproteota archaeon]MCR8462829.1 hypothetical protein [Thermoproteota archaeon]MCR8471122.1 hypothetical protein [Thermoproteota archaeon]MCR8472158.1 hypothetical protein [Thermoproteota archaeon]MCR8473639.1 hypothetical protein [Thermoproteota archaeon]
MYKVAIIYPKRLEDDIILLIGKFGKAELISVPEDKFVGFKKEVPTELHSFHLLIGLLEKLAQKNNVDIKEHVNKVAGVVPVKLYDLGEIQQELKNLEEFFEISTHVEKLKEKLSKLRLIYGLARNSQKVLEILSREFSAIVTLHAELRDFVLENLSAMNLDFETMEIPKDLRRNVGLAGDVIAFVSAPSRDILNAALAVLKVPGVNELSLDIDEIPRNIKDLENTIYDIESSIKKLTAEFEVSFQERALSLVKLWYKANISRKILTAKTMTAKGEYIGVALCWIPEEYFEEFERLLKNLSPSILIRREKPLKGEAPPSYVKIRGSLSPLASILAQMGYPGEGDIFPWILVSILWALMFGYMFPDIGQGAVLFALGAMFAGVKKIRVGIEKLLGFSGKKAGAILMLAGFSATLFGILFGECFLIGLYPPLLPFLKEHWVEDMASIKWVIKIALFIGIAEIILAMLLFMYKNIKHGHYIEGILGEWALPGMLMYIGLISLGFHFLGITLLPPVTVPIINVRIELVFEKYGMEVLNILDPSKSWPVYMILSGVGLLIISGIIERNLGEYASKLIEMPIGMISNTLSFSRLAGFLIGHAAFSIIASKFKVMGTLTYVAGLAFLNLLIIILETIVVSLQALRLLLYEFSTKWYLGGGRYFKPFALG